MPGVNEMRADANRMIPRRRFLHIAAAATVSTAVFGPRLFAAASNALPLTWQGIALGAEASIQILGFPRDHAHHLLRQCRAELVRLEGIFSLYDARSDLSRLNRDGELSNPPDELVDVLRHALHLSGETSGIFDVSILPVCELLAAAGETGPSASALAQVKTRVDYRRISVQPDCIRLGLPGMRLTLNGLAQGYITDRIADLLRSAGCKHTLVDLGEKHALGPHLDGRPWRLGVSSPNNREHIAGVLELSGGALATSGGYGTPYGGGRHHLLDALTGKNRADSFASVSVFAPTALQADGLSTSLSVLSPVDALRLLKRHPDSSAHVILPDNPERLMPLV